MMREGGCLLLAGPLGKRVDGEGEVSLPAPSFFPLSHQGEVGQRHVQIGRWHRLPKVFDEIVGRIAIVKPNKQCPDLGYDGVALELCQHCVSGKVEWGGSPPQI